MQSQVPSVVLYANRQLQDIRGFCCIGTAVISKKVLSASFYENQLTTDSVSFATRIMVLSKKTVSGF